MIFKSKQKSGKKTSKKRIFTVIYTVFLLFSAVFLFSQSSYIGKDAFLQAQEFNYLNVIAVTNSVVSSSGGSVQIDGGTISGSQSELRQGQVLVNVAAYANTGYEFNGWYTDIIGGQLRTRQESHTFLMPNNNLTLYALFSINRYNVSLSVTPSGAGSISGGGMHNHNSQVSINTQAVNDNYQFFRWLEGGYSVADYPNYSFYILSNRSFMAEYKVKVTTNASDGGRVLLNQTQQTQAYFRQNDTITLQALPEEGYVFEGWSMGHISSNPTLSTLVGATAKVYKANFAPIGARVEVRALEGGSIEGSSLDASYSEGEVITLVATPDSDFYFAGWTGVFGGFLQTDSANVFYTITLQDVERGYANFYANFKRRDVLIEVYSVAFGQQSSLGGAVGINSLEAGEYLYQNLSPDTNFSLRAYPKRGYKFVGWYTGIGGELLSKDANYTLPVPLASSKYYGVFEVSYWIEHAITPAGEGTKELPYIIHTAGELAWVALQTNAGVNWSEGVFCELGADIDLKEYIWEPIGSNIFSLGGARWMGTFDGKGYVISGLYIKRQQAGVGYHGLFGSVFSKTSSIKNLGLEDFFVEIGAVQNQYVGGIVGHIEQGSLQKCYAKGGILSLENTSSGFSYLGTLAGASVNGKINNCFAFGNINLYNLAQDRGYVGGLVGSNYGIEAVVSQTYARVDVVIDTKNLGASSEYVGQIVGYNSVGARVEHSFCKINEDYPPVGVDQALVEGVEELFEEEFSLFSTFSATQGWDFGYIWIMPPATYNEGAPVIRGVGNLVVNAYAGQNGKIIPSGQKVYYPTEGRVVYLIVPDKGYEVENIFLNQSPQSQHVGTRQGVEVVFDRFAGVNIIEVYFTPQKLRPIDIALIIGGSTIFLGTMFLVLKRVFRQSLARKKRLRGSIKKYKRTIKNKN